MYDRMTWNDFAYQEEHGHLPDQGMTADDLHEMFGDDTDPEEIREILALRSREEALPSLPCGCTPHETRVTEWSAIYCDTEEQPYCNFECPHQT